MSGPSENSYLSHSILPPPTLMKRTESITSPFFMARISIVFGCGMSIVVVSNMISHSIGARVAFMTRSVP